MITGAGGFIGKFLSNYLSRQYNVNAVTRQDLDLCNAAAVDEHFSNANYDVIIHCAVAGRNDLDVVNDKIYVDNTTSWNNLIKHTSRFKKLINVASGAEFDLSTDINEVSEQEIWNRYPLQSYGQSKNHISRQATCIPNFYNLRLFGCFDTSESSARVLKRAHICLIENKPFFIDNDRNFDMVSAADFASVVSATVNNKITDNDLNIVYQQKYKLSEILKLFASLHGYDQALIVPRSSSPNNYTGNGVKLAKYDLPLIGLKQSLKNYCLTK